jgi:DNA-binding IclR family transcriptional regulator
MSTGPGVQTLDRGLRLLHLLAAEPGGLTVGELSERLGVHRAIVYRLVGTLGQHRLVVRGADGRHRLWTGLVELARAVAPDWRSVALPELEALAEDLGATATLSVAAEDFAVALVVVEPRNTAIHVAYRPGLRHPLTRGASGKAILAGRPAEPDEPADVRQARRRGYAVTRGELQAGAVGIAAPVVVDGRAEASVGAVSFTDFDGASVGRVLEAAARLAAAFPNGTRELPR